jgi:hypothetical protein
MIGRAITVSGLGLGLEYKSETVCDDCSYSISILVETLDGQEFLGQIDPLAGCSRTWRPVCDGEV